MGGLAGSTRADGRRKRGPAAMECGGLPVYGCRTGDLWSFTGAGADLAIILESDPEDLKPQLAIPQAYVQEHLC